MILLNEIQVAKNYLIFLKINSSLALAPKTNDLKIQFDWLKNIDFTERKSSVTDDTRQAEDRPTTKLIIELVG